jgi:hypothetical protein
VKTANPVTKTALAVRDLKTPKKYFPVAELERVREESALLGQQIQVMIVYAGQMYQVAEGFVEMVNIDNDIEFEPLHFGDTQTRLKPTSRSTISITVRR